MPPATSRALPASDRPETRENRHLAARLDEYADLLEEQAANPFRVRAYRKAAETVAALNPPASETLAKSGRQGLDDLPGIGPRIAAALAELVLTGRWSQLDRLRGRAHPEALFRTVPGVGPTLARRLVEDLHLSSLEAFELAAHDGRLAGAPGWGPRRVSMVKAVLAERLGQPRRRRLQDASRKPPVDVLLDVDREFREGAAAGRLPRVAPRRFNPQGEAWLSILHTERGEWRFTALYSNTGLAHRLGRTRDWVIVFYEADAVPEGQCTVVTETHGRQAGHRVVRGREAESARPVAPCREAGAASCSAVRSAQ